MSSKRNISILVGIIGILILLLTASVGYIFANNENWIEKKTDHKNKQVLKEIYKLKSIYDAKIADKTNNYMVLQLQKDSIQNLVAALETSRNNEESLQKYKTEYKNLEEKMRVLVDEIDILKSKKTKIALKNDVLVSEGKVKKSTVIAKKNGLVSKKSIVNKLENTVVSKSNLTSENSIKTVPEVVVSKTKKNSKITLSNIKVEAFTSKSANKKVATLFASNTNFLKISFVLNENLEAESGEKTFYFQVINSNNNVMGKRITEYFDSESLTYSFSKSVTYNNQSLQVAQEFLASDFEKGYYFINIFDRDQMIGKTSILLK